MRDDIAKEFERLLREKCERMEVKILDLSVQPDHIHLFVSAPPRYAPSQLINAFKGYTSRYLKEEYPHLKKLTGNESLWTDTYYVGTAGTVSAETIRHYIEECQD
uniref:IS200/IS605 family transposase n=1 Tax=Caldanaerobius fijiensis TaxID=456330 RepID=UPI002286B19E|nr:IS200/IS605 family transposase [Caldanaerobius fijiensis]